MRRTLPIIALALGGWLTAAPPAIAGPLERCEAGDRHSCAAVTMKPGFTKAQKAQAHYFMGVTEMKRGRMWDAIEHFTHALGVVPRFWEALGERGAAYYEVGDHKGAIIDLNAAIRIKGDSAELHSRRARSYHRLDRLEEAVADYTTAIQLGSRNYADYYNRGNAHRKLGNDPAAIADYTFALKLKPDHIQSLNNRGNAYKRRGDFDRALADYDRAIAISPSFRVAIDNRERAIAARDAAARERVELPAETPAAKGETATTAIPHPAKAKPAPATEPTRKPQQVATAQPAKAKPAADERKMIDVFFAVTLNLAEGHDRPVRFCGKTALDEPTYKAFGKTTQNVNLWEHHHGVSKKVKFLISSRRNAVWDKLAGLLGNNNVYKTTVECAAPHFGGSKTAEDCLYGILQRETEMMVFNSRQELTDLYDHYCQWWKDDYVPKAGGRDPRATVIDFGQLAAITAD